MIERIILQLADESGNAVLIDEDNIGLQMKLDAAIYKAFNGIVDLHNLINDDEIKIAEKFVFAKTLTNFWEEQINAYRTTD